jgi:transglutaminase-like putative cysteine protease
MRIKLDGDIFSGGVLSEVEKRNYFFAGTSTIDNVGVIRRLIKDSINDGITRETAENILQGVPEKNWKLEIQAIFDYVEQNMRYTRDMADVEMVKTPARHISDINGPRAQAFGDCDDFVTLLGALLYNAGYENLRLVIMRSVNNTTADYNHIYLQALIPGTVQWVSLDASEKQQAAGWEPPAIERKYFNV